jgi:hypothetical protein
LGVSGGAVHRDAAAVSNFSGEANSHKLRSHIIDRGCAASEGSREQEGTRISPPRSRRRNASQTTGSISRLDQKNYATPKPIVAKITGLIK